MRTLVLQEFVTLDGLAAGPGDIVDFIPGSTAGDESFGRQQLAFLQTIDTILLGRATYQMFAAFWPDVAAGPEKAFADLLNSIPKMVFSQTLDRAPWGKWDEARIVRQRPADELATLKRQPGKDIVVWGSISLAQSMMDEGLVDEYRLVVCPVVLGSGRHLFNRRAAPLDMKLLDATVHDRGAVSLRYV